MRITQGEIEAGLRDLGLKSGDMVIVHSSLASLGKVENGAEAVVNAFLAVLGTGGTLVVPTFGKLGIIADMVKEHPHAVKSIHPKACVAAIGKRAHEICRDHWKAELAHAEDTPYVRIAELGGYVCLLGVDQDRNTTLHTVEELLRLPYLQKTADVAFDTPEGKVTKSWPFFPGPHRDFIGLDRPLRESGVLRVGRIGNAVVRLVKSSDLIRIARAIGQKNPAFVLCDNPHCDDCVKQRAALRKDQFSRESFKLAVAASLAGTYAEEISDHCQAAGIDAVELDCVKGKPLPSCNPGEVEQQVDGLRASGLRVTAIRLTAASIKLSDLLQVAKDKSIDRVVVPLSPKSVEHAALAQKSGMGISFFNLGIDSELASQILLDIKATGVDVGFTFNASHFAHAGEKPFLHSYKKKLNRFVDQLDVQDACFDGTPAELGRGNAEIKEMISILRAGSFSGWMVLRAGCPNRTPLLEVVQQFERLLKTM